MKRGDPEQTPSSYLYRGRVYIDVPRKYYVDRYRFDEDGICYGILKRRSSALVILMVVVLSVLAVTGVYYCLSHSGSGHVVLYDNMVFIDDQSVHLNIQNPECNSSDVVVQLLSMSGGIITDPVTIAPGKSVSSVPLFGNVKTMGASSCRLSYEIVSSKIKREYTVVVMPFT